MLLRSVIYLRTVYACKVLAISHTTVVDNDTRMLLQHAKIFRHVNAASTKFQCLIRSIYLLMKKQKSNYTYFVSA